MPAVVVYGMMHLASVTQTRRILTFSIAMNYAIFGQYEFQVRLITGPAKSCPVL
jgi:hypothetical protein